MTNVAPARGKKKRFKVPQILIVHLKRFAFNQYGVPGRAGRAGRAAMICFGVLFVRAVHFGEHVCCS